jgi:hypothetical protein
VQFNPANAQLRGRLYRKDLVAKGGKPRGVHATTGAYVQHMARSGGYEMQGCAVFLGWPHGLISPDQGFGVNVIALRPANVHGGSVKFTPF